MHHAHGPEGLPVTELQELALEEQDQRGEDERHPQGRGDQGRIVDALSLEVSERQQGERGARQAAGAHEPDYAPIDGALLVVHEDPTAFCDGRIEQIGPHRNGRIHTE
jgi:hypothetical protein